MFSKPVSFLSFGLWMVVLLLTSTTTTATSLRGGGGARQLPAETPPGGDDTEQVAVVGNYEIFPDLSTLTFETVDESECHVTVGHEDIVFDGIIEGTATGSVMVVVDDVCGPDGENVLPPGQVTDTFVATLEFQGTIDPGYFKKLKGLDSYNEDGVIVVTSANVEFIGSTAVGGAVTGNFVFSGDEIVDGTVPVYSATVGEGGSYRGSVEVVAEENN